MVDRRFIFARGSQASVYGLQEPLFERNTSFGYPVNSNFVQPPILPSPSPLGNGGYYFNGRTNSEDHMEIQQYRGLLEVTHHRVIKLEKMAKELEALLDDQNKQRLTLEKECSSLRKQREDNCKTLQSEINNWQKSCEAERKKGERIREQLSKELYGMMQKKYSVMRGALHGHKAKPNKGETPSESSPPHREEQKSSPPIHFASSSNFGGGSTYNSNETQASRDEQTISELADFLGF